MIDDPVAAAVSCRALRPRYRPYAVDEGLFLVAERENRFFEGRVYADLLPFLMTGVDAERAADELEAVYPRPVIHYALHNLDAAGVLIEAGRLGFGPETAFWDALDAPLPAADSCVSLTCVGDIAESDIVEALASAGVATHPTDGLLDVVVTDDYLSPGLEPLGKAHRETSRPWLLARATGTEAWVGPLFVSEGPCYACLASRLRLNDPLNLLLRRIAPASFATSRAEASTAVQRRLVADALALRVAQRLARGDRLEGVWTLDLSTWEAAMHPLDRRPQCPVCGDLGLQAEQSARPVVIGNDPPLQRGRGSYLRYVDRLTGIVTALERAPTGAPLLHSYTAYFGFASGARDVDAYKNGLLSQAAGVGRDEDSAKIGAVCEAIERYCGMAQGDEPSIPAAYAQLDAATTVHPATCMLYSERQYARRDEINAKRAPFDLVPKRFDERAVIDWTGLWSLSEGLFKLLPTTYLYYNHPQPPSGPYCWADSNGCAAGASLADAVRRALLELVERDSVAIWWYNRVRRPCVDLTTFGDSFFDAMMATYARLGRSLWVLDVTTDTDVPTFAAVSHADGATEDILLSFGADLDARAAIDHALCELNHLLPAVLLENRTAEGDYPYPDSSQQAWYRTATLASEPYLVPSNDVRVASHYASRAGCSFAEDVSELCLRLGRLGLEVLVLDQTRPDVDVPVVKVVVPGLRHFWARFAPGRLYDAPVRLGWIDSPRTEEDLNPVSMFL